MFLIFVVWILVRDILRPLMDSVEYAKFNRGQERLTGCAILAAILDIVWVAAVLFHYLNGVLK